MSTETKSAKHKKEKPTPCPAQFAQSPLPLKS